MRISDWSSDVCSSDLEAKAAPWDIIMMFGGGLVLAEAITRAGLAVWLGERLTMLNEVPLVVMALVLTAFIILVTEFASNVASASGFMPVVAGLMIATGDRKSTRLNSRH